MKQVVQTMDSEISPVPTIWKGSSLSELSKVTFPKRWVLKPNHLSGGRVLIGEGEPNYDEISLLKEQWESQTDVSQYLGEWAYTFAEPSMLLEPWIGGASITDVPIDYKFFVFHGDVKLIQAHSGRGTDHRIYHLDTNWQPLNVSTSRDGEVSLRRPENLAEMVRQAEVIGAGFDFMRVDLYDTPWGVLFGEVTPYPASGFRRFRPRAFDRLLGNLWTLPTQQ